MIVSNNRPGVFALRSVVALLHGVRGMLGSVVVLACLGGCERGKPGFFAPYTYKLQGTSVISVGPPDELCGAAHNEVAPETSLWFHVQPPRVLEFDVGVRLENEGRVYVNDGDGCDIAVEANDAQDVLSANDSSCDLAADAPVRFWGVNERKYLHFTIDFRRRTWSESLRSLAVDNTQESSVQCAVAAGIVLEDK